MVQVGDAKTCCEYLLTKNINNEIDPRQLLRKRQRIQTSISAAADIRVAQSIETFVKTVGANNWPNAMLLIAQH